MKNELFALETNPITGLLYHRLNYLNITNGIRELRRSITTEEEYCVWVKDWKVFHRLVVEAIQYMRLIKNRIKYDKAFAVTTNQTANDLQYLKKTFGSYAKALYDMRIENKARLKAGEFIMEAA